jgi:hypothetical protein
MDFKETDRIESPCPLRPIHGPTTCLMSSTSEGYSTLMTKGGGPPTTLIKRQGNPLFPALWDSVNEIYQLLIPKRA